MNDDLFLGVFGYVQTEALCRKALAHTYTSEEIDVWFELPHPYLDWRTPRAAIRSGHEGSAATVALAISLREGVSL